MADFRIKLAGFPIEVDCAFDSTKEYCKKYLTDEAPAFAVRVTDADRLRENTLSERRFSEQYLELLALYRAICERLLKEGVCLLHGSAISVDGEVYIFIAPSGTGKSTHTSFWRRALSDGHEVVMVNDDKPLLRVTEKGVFACGTPWSGTYHLDTDVSLPVKAICLLRRDTVNHIEPLAPRQALPELYQRVYLPESREAMGQLMSMLSAVLHQVGFWSLGCDMSVEAALLAYRTVKKGDNK